MPTFSPPGALERTGHSHPLFGRMRITRGVSVLKSSGVYAQVREPSAEQVEDADIAYLGGYSYIVSAGEAAALTAAGYGEWVE